MQCASFIILDCYDLYEAEKLCIHSWHFGRFPLKFSEMIVLEILFGMMFIFLVWNFKLLAMYVWLTNLLANWER